MNDPMKQLEPWSDSDASHWLVHLDSWKKVAAQTVTTLQLEPTQFPHRIRAAAAMVIMFGRPDIWPAADLRQFDKVIDLARRQLVQVKSYFTSEARRVAAMASSPAYRTLMQSLDEEIRILESRMTDPPMKLNQQPPVTWGDFWTL